MAGHSAAWHCTPITAHMAWACPETLTWREAGEKEQGPRGLLSLCLGQTSW